MNNLIVNADDFGQKTSVNKAVAEAFSRDWINSTTIMANMPGFEEAVNLAHQLHISHKVGVHLVLTSGHPLTDQMPSIPFLFREKPLPRKVLLPKLFLLNKQDKILIFKELEAQIKKVRKNNIPITHLDSHHHIHEVWPINQMVVSLLRDFNIPGMRILNNLESSRQMYKRWYRGAVNRYLKCKKINHSDFFGSRIDFLSRLQKKTAFKKDAIIEVMVHPDYNEDGKLVDRLGHFEYELDFRRNLQERWKI